VFPQDCDEIPRLDDLLRIEAGGGFIEDQDLGVVDDRLRESHALPVSFDSFPQARDAMSSTRVRFMMSRRATCVRGGHALDPRDEVEILADSLIGG